jgi:hypothetical protein
MSALTWTPVYARDLTAFPLEFEFTGTQQDLVAMLESKGYEVDDSTDHVDAFTRDARGRRRKQVTFREFRPALQDEPAC